jgi:hypothetical protein
VMRRRHRIGHFGNDDLSQTSTDNLLQGRDSLVRSKMTGGLCPYLTPPLGGSTWITGSLVSYH